MSTLPELTRVIDQAFMSTWYEIKPEAVDNILDATVITAALKESGCFKTQVGGEWITESIGYGTEAAKAVAKGDVLPQGEPELDTMAKWNWRYLATHVQRSVFDDQKNNGKFRIKSFVARRIKAARLALIQQYEKDFLRAENIAEDGKNIQGLNDVLPTCTGVTSATGVPSAGNVVSSSATYGGLAVSVASGNSWWWPRYRAFTLPIEVNMLSDMRTLYNLVGRNQDPPNLIITTQALYEMYEDFVLDHTQIIKEESTKLADLGYEVVKFKNKRMIWSPNVIDGDIMMMNTKHIKVIYDPNMWFDMTRFKDIPLQGSRIAHILCAMNMTTDQRRRHGRLYTA